MAEQESLDVVLFVRVTRADASALDELLKAERQRRPRERIRRADLLRAIIGKAVDRVRA